MKIWFTWYSTESGESLQPLSQGRKTETIVISFDCVRGVWVHFSIHVDSLLHVLGVACKSRH